MKRFPLYILDLDGTLYRGGEPTPGAVDTVRTLRSEGSQIRFLTNNSTQTQDVFVRKLNDLGFEAQTHEVYSTATGTAMYLNGQVRSALVVGEKGLESAVSQAGITVTEVNPEAVVVGLCRHFDYDLMARAMVPLLDPAVRFVATNRDATYPMEGGKLIPGAGSIVAALATCCAREPELVGKPSSFLVERILADADIRADDALVVGDRMDTDVEAGVRAGCPVHLVLCGVTAEAPEGISSSPDLRGLL